MQGSMIWSVLPGKISANGVSQVHAPDCGRDHMSTRTLSKLRSYQVWYLRFPHLQVQSTRTCLQLSSPPFLPSFSAQFPLPLHVNDMARLSRFGALLVGIASFATALYQNGSVIAPCDSPLYCYGDILRQIELAQPFTDSKTFVDL